MHMIDDADDEVRMMGVDWCTKREDGWSEMFVFFVLKLRTWFRNFLDTSTNRENGKLNCVYICLHLS